MIDITDLAVIPNETALQVFTMDGMIDPYLTQIRQEIDKFVPDLSTKKGRDNIASFAYKIAKCKTQIDAVGKEQTDIQKEIPKKIDAIRKRVRDTLDEWKDEVRKPLDEWEAAENTRHEKIKSLLSEFQSIIDDHGNHPSLTLQDRLAEVKGRSIDEDTYQEFLTVAKELHAKAVATIEGHCAAAKKREAEAAELEQLRAERAAREQKEREEKAAQEKKDREDRIAKEAAEAATKKAQEELVAAKRREEAAKQEAETARSRAEKAEREAKEKADREHKAKLAAEEEAARKREANKKHRAKINNAILGAFVENGIEEAQAKSVIELIAKGLIPHVTIGY